MFDVGGIVGGFLIGALSDLLLSRGGGRTLVVFPTLIMTAISIFLYRFVASEGKSINSVFMFICGIFTNGASNLMNSAVSADLGNHPLLKGTVYNFLQSF